MANPKLIFRIHAIQRMFERHITEADVRHIIRTGEVIANYPDDKPYPSRLILGWRKMRPLHIGAADNSDENQIIIITAYEPDPAQWTSDFRRREA